MQMSGVDIVNMNATYVFLPPDMTVVSPQIQQEQASQLIRRFEDAFVNRQLDQLHNPGRNMIKVIYEHSIAESSDEQILFSSFHQIEQWLRSREYDDTQEGGDITPIREVRSGQFVTAGLYLYDNQGILHNHLYLKAVRIIDIGSAPSIAEIIFYDGD